mmetsp:Transcript_8872/g.22984  ORF Transcript_8872/g.22984 Transcript_8872/m.22984 type:complete len:441 (+) Transcript_8872:407-1729(+)
MLLVDRREHAQERHADHRRRVREPLHQLGHKLRLAERLVDPRARAQDLSERVEKVLKGGGRLRVEHLDQALDALGLLQDSLHLARLIREPRREGLEGVIPPCLLCEQLDVEASTRVLPQLCARALRRARNVAQHRERDVLELRRAEDGVLQVGHDPSRRRAHHRLLLPQPVQLAEVVQGEQHLPSHLEGERRVIAHAVEQEHERDHSARALERLDVRGWPHREVAHALQHGEHRLRREATRLLQREHHVLEHSEHAARDRLVRVREEQEHVRRLRDHVVVLGAIVVALQVASHVQHARETLDRAVRVQQAAEIGARCSPRAHLEQAPDRVDSEHRLLAPVGKLRLDQLDEHGQGVRGHEHRERRRPCAAHRVDEGGDLQQHGRADARDGREQGDRGHRAEQAQVLAHVARARRGEDAAQPQQRLEQRLLLRRRQQCCLLQ